MKTIFTLIIIAVIVVVGLIYVIVTRNGTDPNTVRNAIRAGAIIVDVRTSEEYAGGHYPGAVNIPLAEVDHRISEFGDRTGQIVVYCRSGNRSGKAQSILKANGYMNVINGGGLRVMPH